MWDKWLQCCEWMGSGHWVRHAELFENVEGVYGVAIEGKLFRNGNEIPRN